MSWDNTFTLRFSMNILIFVYFILFRSHMELSCNASLFARQHNNFNYLGVLRLFVVACGERQQFSCVVTALPLKFLMNNF